MSNTKKMLADVAAFDYDAVSGPQVKRIKSLELYSAAEMRNVSEALAKMTNLMLCAQEYYVTKTAKAKAAMRSMNQ